MRYSPRSSVTALRSFSISTGLDASTVTPGRTAPDVSVTTPAMLAALVPWPDAVSGNETIADATRNRTTTACMLIVHLGSSHDSPRDRVVESRTAGAERGRSYTSGSAVVQIF